VVLFDRSMGQFRQPLACPQSKRVDEVISGIAGRGTKNRLLFAMGQGWWGEMRHGESSAVQWHDAACCGEVKAILDSYTQVSVVQPILSAIDRIATHWESCSPWCSKTIRTARSRTSGEYLVGFGMTPSSQKWSLRQSRGGS
jgi:hypothetical protein